MNYLQLILINYYCCWGLILQQAFVLESSWEDTGPLLSLLLLGGGVSGVSSSCGASVGFLTRYDGELREPLVWY